MTNLMGRELIDLKPEGETYLQRLEFVRSVYRECERRGEEPFRYMCDWLSIFTPIEDHAWSHLSAANLDFLPQFPIGRFYADFANPAQKLVIECDGRKWHQDKRRDAERDREMSAMGWRVYRLTGRECVAPCIDFEGLSELDSEARDTLIEDWAMNTMSGFSHALAIVRFGASSTVMPEFLASCTVQSHERGWI